MKKKILSILTAITLICASLSTVCLVSATDDQRIKADAFSVPTTDSYDNGNATIVNQENSLLVNGVPTETDGQKGGINARYVYNQKIAVNTDGFEIKFTVNSKPNGCLYFSLFKEGSICGWGSYALSGIVVSLRFQYGDALSGLVYDQAPNYPVYSLQNPQFDFSSTTDYTIKVTFENNQYIVKLNGTTIATHSSVPDSAADGNCPWLAPELAQGAVFSFSYANAGDNDATPFNMNIKSINGKACGDAPVESEISSETSSETSSESSTSSEESQVVPPAEDTNLDKFIPVGNIETAKIEETAKGIKMSGPVGDTQNFSYMYKDKIDIAKDGLKLQLSFDQNSPANQFIAIALGDIATGWGGWNNSNPDKGLVLVVRPTDSFIEIHRMNGGDWPDHKGDMSKNFEIVKGKMLTLEIKKEDNAYKCYIDGKLMTQFKDSVLNLSEVLDDGAYLTLSALNFTGNKNMPAAITVAAINDTVFAEASNEVSSNTNNNSKPDDTNYEKEPAQTGDMNMVLLFSILAFVACGSLVTIVYQKQKANKQ